MNGRRRPDPWRSFRGVMAATLLLEAIVVLLALPAVATVGGGLTAFSTAYLIGFAVLLVLMAGVQGRPWAIWANVAVQAVFIAGWAVYPGVGFIGICSPWCGSSSSTCAPRCCAGSSADCCRGNSRRTSRNVLISASTKSRARSSPRPSRCVLRSQAIPPSRDSDSPSPDRRHRRLGPGLAARAAAAA